MNKKLVSLVAAVFMFATNAGAVDFSGKTVEWLIPFSPGGGSDKWSRFYAPMLSKALPGNPNVVVITVRVVEELLVQINFLQ